MRRSLAMRVQYYLATRQQNRRRAMVLRCLAVVVVFATAYALIIPAVTQSNKLLCGKEAHEHTDACWTVEMVAPQPELICTVGQNGEIVIHTHDARCYDMNGKLICPLPERELHIHSSDCYREHRELICEEHQSLGHTHGPSCYTYTRGELICGQEVAGGHVHTDACYTMEKGTSPTCGKEESEGHTHTDACYRVERSDTPSCGQEEGEGHVHTDACYTMEKGTSPTCGKEESEGHTHTDACYTEETRRVLTCSQSESGDVLDEEGNVIEAGHSHSDSCYTEETERVLTCGQKEGGGHTHTDACYPTEKVLTCTQEEGGEHVHTDACYPEERTLICGQEESKGHVHTDACYPEEKVLICEEAESGHTHSDECYEWTKELHCQEEERESGHIHTDECYEITELLACQQEELILHTHTDACYEYTYDEETGEIVDQVLICGKPEVVLHQHIDACFFTPEGEPVETAVLTCGMEEHVHTEECYVDIIPKEENIYFCGQNEHIHTDECYFESGELRCTLPEHVHNLACLEKPPEEIEIPGELPPQGPTRIELDDYFDYETDMFHATFHITGVAAVPEPEDSDLPLSTDGGNGYQPEEPADEPGLDSAGDAGSGDGPGQPDDMDLAAGNPGDVSDAGSGDVDSSVVSGDIDVPLADAPNQGDDSDRTDTPDPTEAFDDAQGEDPVQIEFQVNEPDPDSLEYQEIAASVPGSEAEQMILSVLTFSVTSSDGREVDLSQCEVEAEVTFTEELVGALVNMGADTMAIGDGVDIEGEEEPEESPAPEIMIGAFADAAAENETVEDEPLENGTAELDSVVVNEKTAAGPVTMTFRLPAKARGVAFMARSGQFPQYTVEYYAMLNRPVIGTPGDGGVNDMSLPFINTDGRNLPQNGEKGSTKVKYLMRDKPGNVLFKQEETPIYQTAQLRYSTVGSDGQEMDAKTISEVAGIMYNAGSGNINDQDKLHQTLWQIKVWQPGDADDNPTVYPREEISDPDALEKYFEETLKFVNAQSAEDAHERADEKTIAITEGTKLRVVYQPTKGDATHTATFYDYDITDGTGIDEDNRVTTAKKNDKGELEAQGINSPGNYSGSGTKYAFGNSNASSGTGLGNLPWNGNNLNTANRPGIKDSKGNPLPGGKDTFGDCTFGLAQRTGNGVIFSSGIDAPNLFGDDTEGNPTKGRTVYNGQSLGFIREGDTYTLSTATVGGKKTENLECFWQQRNNWNNTKTIISNSFWPMDGVTNGDPHTGGATKPKHSGDLGNDNLLLPESDDKTDHNNYFGMHFKVGFTVPKGYCGPLEYYFYGDDDMWVFLQNQGGGEQLVCDIGGVHSSVGEYVDLWDYVLEPGETPETPRDGDRTFYLDFYYTERGASGSTCWMQFTLPNMIKVPTWTDTETPESQYLRLEKQVNSNVGSDASASYKFNLTLFGESGNFYSILKNGTNIGEIYCDGQAKEIELAVGDKLEIRELPNGTKYRIEEIAGDRSFDVSYTVNGASANLIEGACIGEITEGSNKAEIVCTNYFRAQLPETGGPGDNLYIWAGTLLIAAAGCLWYKRRSYRGGARDET